MDGVVFLTANTGLTLMSVRSWFESLGAHWESGRGFECGTLEKCGVVTYIDYEAGDDVGMLAYDPEELAEMKRLLGGPLAASVSIHIGRGSTDTDDDRSNDLARNVGRQLIAKWGGYVDACGTPGWENLY